MRTIKFAMTLTPDGDVVVNDGAAERVASQALKNAAVSQPLEFEGGMIVMSTDVNATQAKGMLNKAKGFLKTWRNRLMRNRRIDEAVKEQIEEHGLDTGWSVGNLFRGHYYSPKSGDTFDERSFAVDIRGAPFDFVTDVAEVLRKKFDQESVMVINHENNKVYFVE